MRRKFGREGLGYRMAVPDLSIDIAVDRLSRSRGELHGELSVDCGLPGTRSIDGHLHSARFNLSGGTARGTLAKTLIKRANTPDVDWEDLLEDFCRRVMSAEREGDPIEKVGALPIPVGEAYRLDPILPLDQVTILYGDGGCVAGETLLEGPTGAERFDVLAAAGRPFPVWSLDGDGRPVVVLAEAPFRKGRADLYRFDLVTGESVTVMATHRFLAPTGWVFAGDVRVGDRLAVSGRALLPTSSGDGPAASGQGDRGWTRTAEGSMGRCGPSRRRYGRRPLSAAGSDRAGPPSPDGAPARSPSGRLVDGRCASAGRSRPCRRLARPTRSGSSPAGPWEPDAGSGNGASLAALTIESSRDRRPSPRAIVPPSPIPVSGRSAGEHSVGDPFAAGRAPGSVDSRLLSWVPPAGSLYFATVTAVSYVRTDDYYDLHVPGTENYLANGLWHHNTGKSTLAVAMSVAVQEGVSLLERWVPKKAPVLYLDWEAGRASINRRVRGVAMGAHIPRVVQIDYLNCRKRGALYSFAEDVARMVDLGGYGLVVVDSIGMAAGTGGEGSDANESAIRLFAAFGFLDTTVLAIDHVNRTDAEASNRKSRPYGSVYKSNLARATFELRRTRTGEGSVLGLYHTKANDSDLMPPVSLQVTHGDDGSIAYERLEHMPTDLTKPLTLADQIASVLAHGHTSAEDIATEIEAEVPSVRTTLNRHKRRFNKLASGLWELLPEVKSHAS